MSFHAQNQVKLSSWQFIEMWVDPTSDLPYVLMLVGNADGSYTLYDPTERYQVVYSAWEYEKVKDFLLEDEYVQIRGRYQENAEQLSSSKLNQMANALALNGSSQEVQESKNAFV